MRQEELLQFIFLFIFVFLIVVLVGSSISKFGFAETAATTITSVENVSMYNGSSSKVWQGRPAYARITGSLINKPITLKFIYAGAVVTEQQIDCTSNDTVCIGSVNPFTVAGSWIVKVFVDSMQKYEYPFTVASLCGTAHGNSYGATIGTGDLCQSAVTVHGLNLCTSPSVMMDTIISSGTQCNWNCKDADIENACSFSLNSTVNINECVELDPVNSLLASNDLCVGGHLDTSSFLITTSGWSWKCVNGGSTVSCNALKRTSGSCGAANGVGINMAPTSNLCSSGTASVVSFSGTDSDAQFAWTCNGNDGSSISCSAKKSRDGVCAVVPDTKTAPTTNLCTIGTPSTVSTSSSTFNWTCGGLNGGASSSCSAKRISNAISILNTNIVISPDPVIEGNTVSVKVGGTFDSSVVSLSFNYSNGTNNLFITLARCTDGNNFCGAFTAPSVAGIWSVSLGASNGTSINISSPKNFVVVSKTQIPVIGKPIITPSAVSLGDSIEVKVPVANSSSVRKINFSFGGEENTYIRIKNEISSSNVCSGDASSWCKTVNIPTGYSKGNWVLNIISYVDISGNLKEIAGISTTFFVKSTCSYVYSPWSECKDGKQARTVKASPDGCTPGKQEALVQSCGNPCASYVYYPWGDCQNGKQTRKLKEAIPEGCSGTGVVLEKECACDHDKWNCGNWTACTKDGTRSRVCTLTSDCKTVVDAVPVTTDKCVFSTNTTSEVDTNTNTQQNSSNNTPTSNTNQSTKSPEIQVSSDLSMECKNEGIVDSGVCQNYLFQINIVQECLSRKLDSYDACRGYLLSKGDPIKCQKLSSSECDSYIKSVLLADFSFKSISSESETKLNDSVGTVAMVDAKKSTITIVDKTGQSSRVEVSNMPLSPVNSDNIIVNLVSTENSIAKDYLSSIAITFDSNSNGISDDMEARLGVAFDSDKLSGVDKAIVEGKTLEQPKFKKDSVISELLTIEKVENSDKAGAIKFQGKANPNEVVTLFIYSTMPIIITVKSDSNGNWIYELDKSLINGKHEAYVVVNNSEGRILEASLPKPFFIDEAKAVALEDFVRSEDVASVSIPESSDSFILTYVFSGLGFIALLIIIFMFIRREAAKQNKE